MLANRRAALGHGPPPRAVSTRPLCFGTLNSRSQLDPERVELLALLPGRPIVVDICVTHPLAASAVRAAARDAGEAHAELGKVQPHRHGCMPVRPAET